MNSRLIKILESKKSVKEEEEVNEYAGEFSLRITLGNEAMGSQQDVADALRIVAQKMETGETVGKIMDKNGNSVGHFSLDVD